MTKLDRLAAIKARGGQGIEFKPGYIVALEISATGGVTYDREDLREDLDGLRLEAEFKTVKTVDNVDLHKEGRQIVSQAYYALERACVATPIGYYADADMLADLQARVAPLRDAAQAFNRVARMCGSARQVVIEVYPLEITIDNEAAAGRIARVVRERLSILLGALRSGDRKRIDAALEKCRQLDKLAMGIQADAVRLAVEAGKEARSEILEAVKAGSIPAMVGEMLDLGAIENGISLFEDHEQITEAA